MDHEQPFKEFHFNIWNEEQHAGSQLTIQVTKIEVAKRHVEAAVRMMFGSEDPLAIHSVAAAARQIIRDLCEQRGNVESYEQFKDWIAPGREKEFWGAINKSANFLKHADRDAGEIHEINEEENDFTVLYCIHWYKGLGRPLSREMNVFFSWFTMCHPNVLKTGTLPDMLGTKLADDFFSASKLMQAMPRSQKLRAGQKMLEMA